MRVGENVRLAVDRADTGFFLEVVEDTFLNGHRQTHGPQLLAAQVCGKGLLCAKKWHPASRQRGAARGGLQKVTP